jgi:transcriptional regulator with XRE-family HTH domain
VEIEQESGVRLGLGQKPSGPMPERAHQPSATAPARRLNGKSPLRRKAAVSRNPQSSSKKKTLGSVLRARRHSLSLTQRELAAQLAVKPAHVAYLELDRRRPSLSLLSRIAQTLDLDRERLILLSHPEARSFFGERATAELPQPKDQAWREFRRNKNLLARHKVSPKELKVLAQVALLGRITTPRSFLFILNSIRQAVEED